MLDISKFSQCRVLVVGDLILDEYVWGDVDRISPEAPVQIVSVRDESDNLGGSGNVVHNLRALGSDVCAAGVIGNDPFGSRLLEKLEALQVDTAGIVRDAGRPTTRKTRIIAAHQHVLRIDRECCREISAEAVQTIAAAATRQVPEVDVVLVSDYGKGVVTPALMAALTDAACRHRKPVVADPKGRDYAKYNGVTVLTPNLKEAALVAGIDGTDRRTPLAAGEKILAAADIDNLLITCGKDGMVLFERRKQPFVVATRARQVFDVSGAGDTVLAVFGLALAAGASLMTAAIAANAAAGVVVGKLGTATVSIEELTEALGTASA